MHPDTPTDVPLSDENVKERRRIFWSLLWGQRWRLCWGLFALAVCDAMDVMPPLFIKWAIDALESGKGLRVLGNIAAIVVIAALLQAVARYFWRHFLLGASHHVAYDLRDRLYRHLLTLTPSWYHRQKTGDLMSRTTNDVDEVRQMYGIGLLLLIDATLYCISVPVILIWLSPGLSLYVLVPLPLLPFYVTRLGKIIHDRFAVVQADLAKLSDKAQENLAGMRVVKACVRDASELSLFTKISEAFRLSNLRLAWVQAAFHPSLDLMMGVAVFLVIWMGGHRVVNGEISIGTFIAFQASLVKMIWPMIAFGWTISLYQRGMASLGRCTEVLRTRAEIVDTPVAMPGSSQPAPGGNLAPRGELRVRGLTFTYPDAPRPALADIEFSLPAGQTLALIGPVGSGKSTLLNLLLRLIEPQQGEICLNGRPLRDHSLAALRDMIGYVPQDAFLFSTTIAENIAFGLKDLGDLARLRQCMTLACFDTEVAAMPNGLETLLGERGVNLSGGQKQRLALARALARDASLLLLDDAMSAVDTDTEERILAGLRRFMAERTSIIVSHRVSTVAHADMILVLEDGRITERGTHTQLLAAGGYYARLAERQRLRAKLHATGPQPVGDPA